MAQKCYNRERLRFVCIRTAQESLHQKNRGDPAGRPYDAGAKSAEGGLRHTPFTAVQPAPTRTPSVLRRRGSSSLGSRSAARTAPSQTNADIENMIAIAGVVIDRFNTIEKELVTVA